MRPDFVFVIIAIGTFVCATCANSAISSADIQQESESDDDRASLQEDLLRIAATSSEDDDNAMVSAGGESAGRIASAEFGHIQKGLKFGRRLGRPVNRRRRKFGPRKRGGGRRLGRPLKGGGRLGRLLKGGGRRLIGLRRFAGRLLGDAIRGENPDIVTENPTDEAPGPGHPEDSPGKEDGDGGESKPGDSVEGDGGESKPGDLIEDGDGGENKRGGLFSRIKEAIRAELLNLGEEQMAPLQHDDGSVRKQNKFRKRRRGFVYRVKQFLKRLYQVINV